MKRDGCWACDNAEGNRVVGAHEMMLGTRKEFQYLECGECKSLTILEPPANLAEYYPTNYYSFADRRAGLKGYLRCQRLRYALGCGGVVGGFLFRVFGPPHRAAWMKMVGARLNDRILDVGCGSGQLLADLRSAGFKQLAGLDPYTRETPSSERVTIHRRQLSEWHEEQDLVMMHHSFEHMPEPAVVLADVRRILGPGGRALIRIPMANSFAWRHYGAHWVQLDAPRHLFIPSIDGLSRLAASAGLVLAGVEFDSTEFQFWGSELYQHDIPLSGARAEDHFSREQLAKFQRQARELNEQSDGDSACFLLRKI